MAKDNRLFFKLTLDFPDHAKILPLSDAAFRCLVEAIAYSRNQLTDGFLARRYALARWSLEVLRELCDNDPEKPSLIEREEGWYIHDFAHTNDTAADVESRRNRNRQAGKQGGLAKAKRTASKSLSKSLSENVAETETETDKELTTDVVSSRPRKRGTRLTSDWTPQHSTVETIRAERTDIDIDIEHRKFIDYWTAKTGRDATKLDWDATWRNWMRNARSTTTATAPNRSPVDDKVAGWLELAANQTDENTTKGITA